MFLKTIKSFQWLFNNYMEVFQHLPSSAIKQYTDLTTLSSESPIKTCFFFLPVSPLPRRKYVVRPLDNFSTLWHKYTEPGLTIIFPRTHQLSPWDRWWDIICVCYVLVPLLTLVHDVDALLVPSFPRGIHWKLFTVCQPTSWPWLASSCSTW